MIQAHAAESVESVPKSSASPADNITMRPERREERELCADLVKIQWTPESGRTLSEWGILEDISPSGACLQVEQRIPSDTVVSLHFSGDQCQARVKYCNPERGNYLIGVEFENGYRWSRRRFKPEHLIQFRLRRVQP